RTPWCLRPPARAAGAWSRPSEGADAAEGVGRLMTLAGGVVPVELAVFLALGELVRAVAKRLVPGEPAFAEPHFLAVDHVAGRFLRCALYESCHGGILSSMPIRWRERARCFSHSAKRLKRSASR